MMLSLAFLCMPCLTDCRKSVFSSQAARCCYQVRDCAHSVPMQPSALQGSMLGEEEPRPAMSFKEESHGFEQLQEPVPPLSELDSLLHTQRHSALLSAALE